MNLTIKISALVCAIAMLPSTSKAQTMTTTNEIIDCGQVEYRHPVAAEFEVYNSSNRATTISHIETYCGCTVANYSHNKIAAKGKATVKVTYDAKMMGHFCKLIDVYCDNEKTPLTLQMRGMVVREVVDFVGSFPHKMGSLVADKDNLEFDDVSNGDQPQQVIHVRNAGSEVAQPVVMHLPDYLHAEVSPSNLAPGRTAEITITLNSHQLDEYGLTQTKIYLGSRPGEKVSADKEITVSAVLLPNPYDMTEEEIRNAPRIELSTLKLNFDTTSGKRKQKQEILITNMGHSDLQISNLQMFTSGVSLSLNKQVISPNEIAKLKVEIDSDELKNTHGEPKILMITNDPKSPKVVINITVDK